MKSTRIIAALVAVILALAVAVAYLVGRQHGGQASVNRPDSTLTAPAADRVGVSSANPASIPEVPSSTTPAGRLPVGTLAGPTQNQAADLAAGAAVARGEGGVPPGRGETASGGVLVVDGNPKIRFASAPGTNNMVWVQGTSTVHDWRVESRTLGGHMEVGPRFPLGPGKARAGKVEADVSVFVPVRALKSVVGGRPYSSAFDDVMYERLSESAHKQIKYRLTGLTLLEPTKEDATITFDSIGDLTVAGVTREIAMPVEMKVEGHSFRFTGQVALKMSDFGVDPTVSVVAGGLIKARDDIQMGMEWTVIRRD